MRFKRKPQRKYEWRYKYHQHAFTLLFIIWNLYTFTYFSSCFRWTTYPVRHWKSRNWSSHPPSGNFQNQSISFKYEHRFSNSFNNSLHRKAFLQWSFYTIYNIPFSSWKRSSDINFHPYCVEGWRPKFEMSFARTWFKIDCNWTMIQTKFEITF